MDAKQLGTRLFMDCWIDGRVDVLDELLDKDHKFHLADGDLEGVDAYRQLLEGYRRAFSPSIELKHVIGEGHYAAVHYVETGVFLNDWQTPDGLLRSTGQKYSTFGLELIHARQGKILEAWPGHQSLPQYLQAGLCELRSG